MSKIGILTFHRAYNYGAFLQCYALAKYLQDLGHDVEVIDFTPKFLMDAYTKREGIFTKNRVEHSNRIYFFIRRALYLFIKHDYLKKSWKFEKIRNHYIESVINRLPLSKAKVISDNEQDFYEAINNKYDTIVVGSDAVWNDYQTNSPYIYYLENVKCNKKISFAASAYGMSYENKSKEEINRIKEDLDKFDIIATRDYYTQNAIEKITSTKVIHTCDPTLTLDISDFKKYSSNVIEILLENNINIDKKIICVMGPEWLGKKVRQAVSNEYQIVSVYTYNRFCDACINKFNPFEWIVFLGMADLMITTYFHGTIFSLKNATPTICVEKKNAFTSKHQSKISDLLGRLGLKEFLLSSEISANELKKQINYCIKLKDDERWIARINAVLQEEGKTAEGIREYLIN